ncbi:MAG: DUF1566 domain-containing protein [Crocinitomix sp.]|nr:DUF1566 domain-containing protein [Crocinitomix sp.]
MRKIIYLGILLLAVSCKKKDIEAEHHVGEIFEGGIIFSLWEENEVTHGLIASLHDLDGGSGVPWSGNVTTSVGCKSMTNGMANTTAIVTDNNTINRAATFCSSYEGGGYTDWYLPSNRELSELCSNDIVIENVLDNDGNEQTYGLIQEYYAPTYGRYWSSTEHSNTEAWHSSFGGGYFVADYKKTNHYRIRAIRKF